MAKPDKGDSNIKRQGEYLEPCLEIMGILKNQKAFTLLEIIIAIGILAAMTLTMTDITNGIMLSRSRTDKRNESRHGVALTLSKITDDVRTAFKASKNFNDAAYKTGFTGTAGAMNFSSMGNVHYVKNHRDSDQVQIGYSVVNNDHGTLDLVRRQTDYLTGNLETGGLSFVLLSNVKEFRLEYYDSNKKEWVAAWNTDSVSVAGKLPQIVKVFLVVQGEPLNEDETEFKEYSYETWATIDMYQFEVNF